VTLNELRKDIEGIVPPTLTTLDAKGMPNTIHISHAMLMEDDLVGVSRQFFKKTAANLDRDPRACLFVTNQDTYAPFLLHLVRVRVETTGPSFEAMSARVDAIAAATGMSAVFRVKALDVFRVTRIEAVDGLHEP
jgi:adenylate cyclase